MTEANGDHELDDDEPEADEEDEIDEDDEESDGEDENDEDDEEWDDDEDDEPPPSPPHPLTLLKYMEPENISPFEKTEDQVETFFAEFSIISKKKPDQPLNQFKVDLLNHSLANANRLLTDDYRPFPNFQKFEGDILPTASDVVVVLSQYLRSLDRYRTEHTQKSSGDYHYYWLVKDHAEEFLARSPKYDEE